jgi:16S rRNA (cytosine1402-N4)-methyltransferase
MKIIDCTVGDGGHSEMILKKIGPNGKLLALDADAESLLNAERFLHCFENQITFVHDNFSNLASIIKEFYFEPVDGILMDLGWSMSQFKERGRGFSFEKDEPLDMRYVGSQISDIENQISAAEILNTYSIQELERIFRVYGEEKFYKEISKKIVEHRKVEKFETTQQLVNVVLQVYRQKLKSTKEIPWTRGIHPATKIFQALRIEVNHELEVLEQALPQAVEILKKGGRLAVITFHSLEDRMVKHFFKQKEHKVIKLITKKPLVASEEEIRLNASSRSAKLRVVEKL